MEPAAGLHSVGRPSAMRRHRSSCGSCRRGIFRLPLGVSRLAKGESSAAGCSAMAFMALGPQGSTKGSVKQPTVLRSSGAHASSGISALPVMRALLEEEESLLPRQATSERVVPIRNKGFSVFFMMSTFCKLGQS